jgi:hypothetical protein
MGSPRDAYGGIRSRRNQALIWNTGTILRVTSLTARLRGLAESVSARTTFT